MSEISKNKVRLMKKIFIVEDDQAIADSLQFLLEGEGHQIRVAKNGKIALDILNTGLFMPTLILLDLMMPVMDGFEFREKFMAHPLYSSIPIVIMSANVEISEKFPQISPDAYLVKPFNIEKMLSIIESMG